VAGKPWVLTGLTPATTYYDRVCGTNSVSSPGQVCGAVMAFTTTGAPTAPGAVTGSASAITDPGATLSGTLNARRAHDEWCGYVVHDYWSGDGAGREHG
jgi:hypothetical protein